MLSVIEFIVSIPQPGSLDLGPQVAVAKLNKGLAAILEFLPSISDGFTYSQVVGAWRSPSDGQLYHEPGLRFTVALPTNPAGAVDLTPLKRFLQQELGPMWDQEAIYLQHGGVAEILPTFKPDSAEMSSQSSQLALA